jgi:hypothetical protein
MGESTAVTKPSAMVRHAGPWDALLSAPGHRMTPRADDVPAAARDGSKLAALLGALAGVDNLPTAALGARCDLDSRQVWGLLKAPRAVGQVRFSDGRWALTPGFAGREIERAATLLRSKGWQVARPGEKPCR